MTKTFRAVLAVLSAVGTLGAAQAALGVLDATATAAPAPPSTTQALPHEAVAANGTVWATDPSHDQLVGLTTAGAVVRIALPAGSRPVGIVRGPDGLLWFTEAGANDIARGEKTGVVTRFAGPTAGAEPWGITTMPGDLLAFTERSAGKIGIAKPDGGVVGEVTVADGTTRPTGIVTGADG